MRICVIGDSHVACLKFAWDEGLSQLFTSTELTFFASARGRLRSMRPRGRTIVIKDPELRERMAMVSGQEPIIRSGDYDAFLIQGLGFKPEIPPQMLSEDVQHALLHDQFQNSLSHDVLQLLLGVGARNCWISHVPFPAQTSNLATAHPLASSAPRVRTRFQDSFPQRWQQSMFLFQPPTTIASADTPWRTATEFAQNSRRLPDLARKAKSFHKSGENLHMNPQYGKLVLEQLLDKMHVSAKADNLPESNRPASPRNPWQTSTAMPHVDLANSR